MNAYPLRSIPAADIVDSIDHALQRISYAHPADFVSALKDAYAAETEAAPRAALIQLLVNAKLSAGAQRPVCQDTGVVHVFFQLGMDVRIQGDAGMPTPSLQALANQAVARAYTCPTNPLRASMIRDPLGNRTNTRDNTPAIVQIEMVEGDCLHITVAAKGGGGDVKARFTMLNPNESVADWVVEQLPGMGAGWCPPGVLGIGVGGSPEQAMLLAKQALFTPIDMHELRQRGAQDATERLRLELFERINALGIGVQGLGGGHTVLDVKIRHAPSHAALLSVALVPNCAATRFVSFDLDGTGPAVFPPLDLALFDGIPDAYPIGDAIAVNLDTVSKADVAQWRVGQQLLLSGMLYTARDAAHKRLARMLENGEALPVDLQGRAIYYVGPVDPVAGEAVGPAGPTTATRMDAFMPQLLEQTGLLLTIGKAERGPVAVDAIRKAGSAYLMAIGGAAYLVSKAVRSARVVAFADLGMEAIYEFKVDNMPVTVAVDARGRSIHDFTLRAVRG